MSWKTVGIIMILTVVFLKGLILDMGDYDLGFWIVCSILILSVIFVSKAPRVIKEDNGIRKVIIALLIFLVLIPLVFLGTCLLYIGGSSMRNLFIR